MPGHIVMWGKTTLVSEKERKPGTNVTIPKEEHYPDCRKGRLLFDTDWPIVQDLLVLIHGGTA